MKNLSSILPAYAPARVLLVVVIAVLIVGSFTATALMKGSNRPQAKQKDSPSQNKAEDRPQDKAQTHPTAAF
jgi:flagellar basal body-associated protein FliL